MFPVARSTSTEHRTRTRYTGPRQRARNDRQCRDDDARRPAPMPSEASARCNALVPLARSW